MARQLPGDPQVGILLVDSNRLFADVLAMRLREEPQVADVEVAASVSEARNILADLRADLLLIDYGRQDDGSLRLIAELPQREPRPAVVVLSGMRDTRAIFSALQSGVRGWVTKDSSFEVLWEAMREVLHGHMVLSPAVVEPVVGRLLKTLREDKPGTNRHDFVVELSPREYEVLRCLVSGLNKKDIASRLYVSINTVRTHVRHLLRHADEHTTLALVAAARDLGVTGIDDPR